MSNPNGNRVMIKTEIRFVPSHSDDRIMPKLRFNIASLLVVIVVLGVGFAALREASDLWECGLFTVTIGVLLISILLAVHRHESKRTFWLGFALFGWVYLVLTLVPSIESRLITAKGLAYLDSGVLDAYSKTVQAGGTFSGSPKEHTIKAPFQGIILKSRKQDGSLTSYYSALLGGGSGKTTNFVRIGHSLFALLAGWLGGQLSRRFFQSSRLPVPSTLVNAELTSS
jgi:hypothetical protein